MSLVKVGTVISTSMVKTVVVKVTTKIRHPLYKKLITKTKKFKAHSEQPVSIGQKVKIAQTSPIAKDKHFKVMEVVE